jgi:hypothetical protein
MARHERDREDLLAEATALVERLELRVPQQAEPLVLGVRRDGCLSIYFSADLAVHFNTKHEVRRAYIEGTLVKAERESLVAMQRQRSDQAVELLSREMSATEQADFLADTSRKIGEALASLDRGECQVLRQVPEDLSGLERAKKWLAALPDPLRIAQSPHAR